MTCWREIAAFDHFVAWEKKWSEDLEDIDFRERIAVYSYMMDGIDIDLAKTMARADYRLVK